MNTHPAQLPVNNSYSTDNQSRSYLMLSLCYLLLGLLLGTLGAFQYLLPDLLKNKISFQQARPLHVYLVISWIFTAAQGGLYYYLPRVAGRELYWKQGITVQLLLQLCTSILIIVSFFDGQFGGREYFEFPPSLGMGIALSWLPLLINFFLTLRPDYRTAPVYIWSWGTGLVFFMITLSESYLWIFDYFNGNIVRDMTVQWKAMGSMVGSWNMLVYGTGMYVMERISGDKGPCRSKTGYFFYFLGLTNLMFNWGHHTYIIPASPWVKTVSYVISMTELLILGKIIWQWKSTLKDARKNYHHIAYRLLVFADIWIFLNLVLAILISVPALNYYTHGTHITVAHAMGTTIGINTMLLMASVFFILKTENEEGVESGRKTIHAGILISNAALAVFWGSLVASGILKISSSLNRESFSYTMTKSIPFFKLFTYSGAAITAGLLLLVFIALWLLYPEPDPLPPAD
ncbi:MAG: cbb3-type cytochrome c oxidase subunit I [Sphingobacteriales bacterium]|nr:cbb3-type cytochrome c oxidase subunit I [Sphingobacteriales bacterium]